VFIARLKDRDHKNDTRELSSRLTDTEFDEILTTFRKYEETGKARETESWEVIGTGWLVL
jgi:hypothetical protein